MNLIRKEILIQYPFQDGKVNGRDIVFNPYYPKINILDQSIAHTEALINDANVVFVVDRNLIIYLSEFIKGKWSDEIYDSLLLMCYCNDVNIKIITTFSDNEGMSQGRSIDVEQQNFSRVYNSTPKEILKSIDTKNQKYLSNVKNGKEIFVFEDHKMNLIRAGLYKMIQIQSKGARYTEALFEFYKWMYNEFRVTWVLTRFAEILFSNNCPKSIKWNNKPLDQWVDNISRDLLMLKEYGRWQVDGKPKNNHYFLVSFDKIVMSMIRGCLYSNSVKNKDELNHEWLSKYWAAKDIESIKHAQSEFQNRILNNWREPMSKKEVKNIMLDLKHGLTGGQPDPAVVP